PVLSVRLPVDGPRVFVNVDVYAADLVDEVPHSLEAEQHAGVELFDPGVVADRLEDELEALLGVVATGHLRPVRHGVGELGAAGRGTGRLEGRDVYQQITRQRGEVCGLEVLADMQDEVRVVVGGGLAGGAGVLTDDE